MFSEDNSENSFYRLVARWRASDYFWYSILIIITLFCFRSFIQPGIVWKDDFIPRHPAYAWFSLFVWNPLEHGGALNDDLSNAILNSVRAFFSGVLGIEFVSKLYVLIVVGLPGVLMFRALSLFRKNYFGSEDDFGSFLGALFFMINPWVTSRVLSGHFFLINSYAFTPIYLYYLYDYFKGNKSSFKFCAFFSILISMTSNHGVVMTGFITAVFFVWSYIESRDDELVKRVLAVYGVQILLSMFWVLPTLYLLFQDIRFIPEISNLSYALSSNAEWFNIIRLFGYFWNPYDKEIYALSSIAPVWVLSTFITPLLVLLSLRTVWKRKDFTVSFVFIFLVSILLGQGTQLIGERYLWFVNLPFLQLFRDPNKLLYMASLSASFLIGLSFSDLVDSLAPRLEELYAIPRSRSLVALTVLITVMLFTVNFPWLSGDFNGYYSPTPIPDYHKEADEWLSLKDGDFRVLYLPVQDFVSYNWSDTSLNEPSRYLSGIPVLNPPSTPTYDISPYTTIYLQTVQNILFQNKTTRMGAFLNLAHIKYIVLRMDTEPAFIPETVYQNLVHQSDLEVVWNQGALYIFENTGFQSDIIMKPSTEVLVPGGYSGVNQLVYNDVYLADKAVVHPEQNDVFGGQYPLYFSSSNLKDILFSMFIENSSIPLDRYIEEDVWVWDAWTQTTNGDLNLDGRCIRSVDQSPLELYVPVEELGDYIFSMKVSGAVPRISLNNQEISSELDVSLSDGYYWISLNKGLGLNNHTFKIIPTGPLTVDQVHIVSLDDFQNKLAEFNSYLSENPFIFVSEAEEMGGRHSLRYYGAEYSNGGAVSLSYGDEASMILPFEVLVTESYTLKIRGAGTLENNLLSVQVTNLENGRSSSYVTRMGQELGVTTVPGILLEPGRYNVVFMGGNTVLDSLSLVPDRAESLFYDDDNTDKVEYESSMPTSYTIPAGDNSGGMVVFSSSYSSGWVLSQGRRTSEPMLVNFVSMGFQMDFSGLEAEIKFDPQLFMNIGYFVSITTLITFVYLLTRHYKLYTRII